ncbi:MAG: hypothetical protein JSR98_21430 [Proteobacteria bacterium]|nr:hypothetical protein [Pseudomonadota bacterium]
MSDEARKRRLQLRWLTLAEVVGIAALVIAGLGYWDNHREKIQGEREKAADARERKAEAQKEAQAGAAKLTFLITGSAEPGGERLRLTAVHPEQVIQTQAISFPTEVRDHAVQTTGNPRLEAGWFEGGLAKALHDHDDKRKSGRLPVGIVTTFIEDGQTKTDRSIYQIGYSLHPRVLRADKAEMEGLSLVRRGVGEDVQGAVDALWARQEPARPNP